MTDVPGERSDFPAPGSPHRSAILRPLLVWAGIATLLLLTLLASSHLLSSVNAVLGIRGGASAVIGRMLPVVVLSLLGLALVAVVAWLGGGDRRRYLAAVSVGFIVLVAIRVFLSWEFDSGTRGEPLVYGLMAESFLTPVWDLMGRPPGYSLLLAGSYAVVADRQLAVEIVNLFLAVLAGGVVLGLANSLYGARVGVLALLGYAIWPAAALMTVVRIPHIAFDLAVVAAAWAAVGTVPGWKGSALTGVLVGMAQYLRPTAPILLPAYIVARWWPGGSWRSKAAAALVAGLAFLVVLTPVVVYNYERTGSPSISTSDYGGSILYIGTYEPSGGMFSEVASNELIAIAGPDPIARSALGTELAIERIKADPVGILALGIRKQDTLWGTEHYGVQYAIRQSLADQPQHPDATTPILLSQGFYVLVLLAALVAMVLRRNEKDALIPLATLVIWAASATHVLLEVRDRHHAYAVILLLPLAAFTVERAIGWAERRLAHPRPA